jgi:predicted RNase H-like nuclease
VEVVGVDGCRGGWVAVAWDTEARSLSPRAFTCFASVLHAFPDAAAIGVDMPIGLVAHEARQCDVAARRLLGPRHASVFPAPDPRLLFASTYSVALALSHELGIKMMSQQTFGICRKVAEVNWAMTWERQERVFEVYPEVSFWRLAERHPMRYRKTWPEGYEERAALLEATFHLPIWARDDARFIARPAQPDDLLDATVAAWSALRMAEGIAERLPPDSPRDRRGLRMEIVY